MNCTIDASIFVAAARSVEPNHIPSRNFLQKVQSSQVYCPTLALAECAAAIARPTGDSSLAEELVAIVEDFQGAHPKTISQIKSRKLIYGIPETDFLSSAWLLLRLLLYPVKNSICSFRIKFCIWRIIM